MITRAIDIEPGSSSLASASLLQSPRASACAHLVAGEPRGLGDLAVVEGEFLIGIADRMEADHQGARERPRLAAEVAHIAHGQPDFLADLPHDTGFERLAGFDESGQQREHPLRPHRLASQHRAVAAVMHQADHRGVDARKFLVTGDRVDPGPARPDRFGG